MQHIGSRHTVFATPGICSTSSFHLIYSMSDPHTVSCTFLVRLHRWLNGHTTSPTSPERFFAGASSYVSIYRTQNRQRNVACVIIGSLVVSAGYASESAVVTGI